MQRFHSPAPTRAGFVSIHLPFRYGLVIVQQGGLGVGRPYSPIYSTSGGFRIDSFSFLFMTKGKGGGGLGHGIGVPAWC